MLDIDRRKGWCMGVVGCCVVWCWWVVWLWTWFLAVCDTPGGACVFRGFGCFCCVWVAGLLVVVYVYLLLPGA
ncbi:hypothetical protein, partial [Bifidobacterium tissieri]|uniref:hypothetical protein n=1 Tax=Bifidobacterium tissieri TaxID=1630162 RepID=UPI001CC2A0E0